MPEVKELFKFALIPDFNEKLEALASLAEKEDWEYHNTVIGYPKPILYNYIHYTFERIQEENKTCITPDKKFACFKLDWLLSCRNQYTSHLKKICLMMPKINGTLRIFIEEENTTFLVSLYFLIWLIIMMTLPV